MTDARGGQLQVMRIPSPGWIDGDGGPAPASHMNFIIANGAVIVPLYDDAKAGAFAVDAVQSLFPERKAIGLPSTAILTGGGSFHCITQQEPA
jgi:agmatine deiminase